MHTPIINYTNSKNRLCNLQNQTIVRVEQTIKFLEQMMYTTGTNKKTSKNKYLYSRSKLYELMEQRVNIRRRLD